MVNCVKLGGSLPGLPTSPSTMRSACDLRERLRDAWKLWIEHSKKLVNETGSTSR